MGTVESAAFAGALITPSKTAAAPPMVMILRMRESFHGTMIVCEDGALRWACETAGIPTGRYMVGDARVST
ncbi:hypothetical protein Sru01_68810 [Sphaerisporangium rufum]|uniref:Uncharacterized protein n=1 Tax=Sphaerisporangium rufum TaxID=1381558 RepID=A0A919V3N1_9ACTN|nr:hypothetical protein Sru01_68810 [Sphaerisporangium rufum]